MLLYNRIDISEEIDLAKSNKSKEHVICHYCFFNHEFKFQDYACNACHELTMLCLNISNITIIAVKNVDYHCIIHNISKSEVINLLVKYIVLVFSPLITVFLHFLFSIYKMVDIMDIYRYLNISIGTVIKNPEMLEFVPDRRQSK